MHNTSHKSPAHLLGLEIDAEVRKRHRSSDGDVVHTAVLLSREVAYVYEVVIRHLAGGGGHKDATKQRKIKYMLIERPTVAVK